MKKLLAFAALFAVVALTSCKYDDDDLWNSVHGLENRVAKLEELCKQMNTNISSLQTIVTALQNNVYVTGTTPLMKDGKEIGYTITFSKGNPITIYHGKDGQDGEDGITPTISVKKDTDGVYYWTLNGEFIMVDGGKIQAEGKDGTNGTNGTTPQFKIENDYWFVSYDNGANWTQLGKATGEDGIGGDSMFSGVDYKTSTDYVIFTLADGTQIKLPTWSAFEALQRLCPLSTRFGTLDDGLGCLPLDDGAYPPADSLPEYTSTVFGVRLLLVPNKGPQASGSSTPRDAIDRRCT